jgi:HD-GYP domain-containing protein (c-di-GMP phosphodiesterase class II)
MNRDTHKLFESIESLFTIKDLDSLLENTLTEARRFLMADAGTIYLAARGWLHFSFVQNDTLFQGQTKDKYIPSGPSLPVDEASLAGYVAKTGEPILIEDVYNIQDDLPFAFNPAFDQKAHYRTRSILGVPLKTRENQTVGVLQLINAKNESGQVVAFSNDDKLFISQFAQHAAEAIEKAQMSQEMVLRMVELAGLRDPFETGQHAKRVGAYSVELYEKWAETHNVPAREIRTVCDVLSTAAMVHDVGKVAVSDVILKKPGQLTYDEKLQMKQHTIHGARLFRRNISSWDQVSSQVALDHHENWDGSGYPGDIEDLDAEKIYMGPGKQGNKISLYGRIVAIADVYDALISQRAYKNSWKQEHALHFIRYQAGKKFDPDLAHLFLKMEEVLTVIGKKYA